jgi:hypothetical protein
LHGTFEDESLKIQYLLEVFDYLLDVSIGGRFYWVIIFGSHVDAIGRGNHIPEGVNLHPHEVFYMEQGLLIPIEFNGGEYKYMYANMYF